MTRKDRTEGIYSRREVLDESERRQYCLIQLKDLLSYAYRYSEDVKKRFDRAQFNVEKFKTLSDIKHIPILKKKELIFLQSMGKAGVSTILSMVREVVFGVGFAVLLPVWFGLDGVLYSMPVSDVLTFVISVIVIRKTWKALSDGSGSRPQAA